VNIKIVKAFRTTPNEALCTLSGLTPVVIKAEEAAKLYVIMRNSQDHEIDHEVQPKDWLHPADSIRLTEQQDEHAMQFFIDGSKSGRSWNSYIYPGQTSAAGKVHTSQKMF